jgi:hypothetical protein
MSASWDFSVTGRGGFPLDMLRYDAAYPIDQESVADIDYSLQTAHRVERLKDKKPFRVNLRSRVAAPTVERWRSFGWELDGPVKKNK